MAYLPKGWEGSDMVRLAKPSLIKALELLSLGSSELPCKEAGTPPPCQGCYMEVAPVSSPSGAQPFNRLLGYHTCD